MKKNAQERPFWVHQLRKDEKVIPQQSCERGGFGDFFNCIWAYRKNCPQWLQELCEKAVIIQRNPKTGRYFKISPEETEFNRWNGTIIQQTKQCSTCASLRPVRVIGESGAIGVCNKGVAWKVVVKVDKPRKCMKV